MRAFLFPKPRILRSEIALRKQQLMELNPDRYAAWAREEALLSKSLNTASDTSRGGGQRQATRRGFDVGLSSLDNYRGRDPIRAFGSTKTEHELIVSPLLTPKSTQHTYISPLLHHITESPPVVSPHS